ncbi:MAG: UDP-2,3-diacylglucosamine diphosphatase LpxI [Xanthobacteraceae bacterium]
MADVQPPDDALAIICGGGSFPAAVADAVARRGRRPVMFGIKGWADAAVIERYAHHWIAIGQAGRFFRLARNEHCRDVLFIGTVLRPPLSALRLDWQTIKLVPRVIRFFRGGDDKLLSGVAGVAETGGLRVVGVKDVAPEIFVPQGVLGRHAPTERDKADIARALTVIAALGPFDVGQAAIVANNNVLAVEAAEGTDNMLVRIAELRKLGRVTSPLGAGVLVKAPKSGQDRRFDLPSIGPRTIENIARAGLAGLAVTAGSTMIAEADQAIAAADRAGIFLVGVSEDAREERAR